MNKLNNKQESHVFTVSGLNQQSRLLLEKQLSDVWLEGEVSNFVEPASGHWYLTLKDEKAQIRGAMFRGKNRLANFTPENGMHVLVQARVSLYEPRGDYQLIINKLEEIGDGRLRRAFEQLKRKLDKEGLFAEARKRPIPKIPQCLGVITSSTGAAIRDILTVLRRRYPSLPVIIYPSEVQGEKAAEALIHNLKLANKQSDCDVLLISRGGGSLEDLWCFNDERLAREIANSKIPIVSGIGHEIDFTIADYVADQRAATPSAAAELISPDSRQLIATLNELLKSLQLSLRYELQEKAHALLKVEKNLQHPGDKIRQQMQSFDLQEQALQHAWQSYIATLTYRLQQCYTLFIEQHPRNQLALRQQQYHSLRMRLLQTYKNTDQQNQQKLAIICQKLETLSPLATLARGYAIVMKEQSQIVTHCKQISVGDTLEIQLQDGSLLTEIAQVKID